MHAQIDEAGTGQLVSIVYSSTATVDFTDADLAALLLQSRMNNAARGLTGMLLYRDGQFMQLLEGPSHAVRTTLAVIAADPRHDGIWTLDERPILERGFGSWSMGYRALVADDELPAEWFGSPEASNRGAGRATESRAGDLLAWFRDH